MKKSKIWISLCLIFILGLSLCGCDSKAKLNIENHEWNFSMVQSAENGEILYCSADTQELYEDADVLDLWNNIKDGKLLISNNDTQETWSLDYSLKSSDSNSNIYEVTYIADDVKTSGMATVGLTTRDNGDDEYTLIISIEEYAVYFTAKK